MTKTCKPLSASSALLILSVALIFTQSALALFNTTVPEEKQTHDKKPVERTISLKLPIKNVHFHWEFFDKSELLAGSLRLRISRGGKTEEIVVFQDGKFSDGWGTLIDQSMGKKGKDPIYFGFRSQRKYLTAPADKVEVVLVAKQDLKGIGALLAGHLPAGTYKSETRSAWLTDKAQAGVPAMFLGNAAFEAWTQQWSLVVTSDQGWTPQEQADAVRKMMKQLDTETKTDTEPKPDGNGSPEDRERGMRLIGGDLSVATNEVERFYALNRAARNALRDGEIKKGEALAIELARLAPKYTNDWNYGNAIQDANQVLGRIALSKDDVAEAKKRLLASASSKGSPQMNSFGPNMQLAKALLEKGERDVVLEYFNRCGAFWEMGKERLAAWTAAVKKGEIPEFGGNLKY